MVEDWGGGFLVESDQQQWPHADPVQPQEAHGTSAQHRGGQGDYGGGFLIEEEHGEASMWGSGGGGGAGSQGGCMECGCMSFNAAWAQTFGVLLCEACKREFKLVSKSAAKTAYLLTDRDLRKLGYLSRANPQHPNWTAMQLYLQAQVEDVARAKHGDLERVEELKHQRVQEKVKERLKRPLPSSIDGTDGAGAAGPAEDGKEGAPVSAAQKRIRSRLQEEYAASQQQPQKLSQQRRQAPPELAVAGGRTCGGGSGGDVEEI